MLLSEQILLLSPFQGAMFCLRSFWGGLFFAVMAEMLTLLPEAAFSLKKKAPLMKS